MERKRRPEEIHLAGLYARNLGANLIGVMTVEVLNIFSPLEVFGLEKAPIFADRGWLLILVLYPVIFLVAGLLQYLVQRPISKLISQSRARQKIDGELQERARRRLLNLPFILGLVTLVAWIFIPALLATLFSFSSSVSVNAPVFTFFRASIIGIISPFLSFFLVEDFSRRKLIPWVLPQGKLSAVPGTIRMPIGRRIRILYTAGTFVPMIILVGTLFFTLWKMDVTTISVGQFGRGILVFTIFLCAIFTIIALKLNSLVRKSISNPLSEVLDVVGKVENGDLTKRIRVVSNDEVGILGDAGNEMITALIEREKIRDTFGKFVTPEIRDQVLAGRIPVNGQRREATLLFSDLRDFTNYVEENEPEEVIKSMRAYFTAMEAAIHKHKGVVLQYVGDEVEAVFGVPLAYAGHADKAVQAALEMRKGLAELNRVRVKEGKRPFRHGIGIHTGEVLAGTVGSKDRLSYSLIGDTVNLASRIQDMTKEFQCDILASENTVKRLDKSLDMERKLPQKVKGYSKPITVFQIHKIHP